MVCRGSFPQSLGTNKLNHILANSPDTGAPHRRLVVPFPCVSGRFPENKSGCRTDAGARLGRPLSLGKVKGKQQNGGVSLFKGTPPRKNTISQINTTLQLTFWFPLKPSNTEPHPHGIGSEASAFTNYIAGLPRSSALPIP